MTIGIDTKICHKLECRYYSETPRDVAYGWTLKRCGLYVNGKGFIYLNGYQYIPEHCPNKNIQLLTSSKEKE